MPRLSRYGWRVAEPARRPVLFVNPRSGGGKAAQAGMIERARERGVHARVLGPHQDLAALVDEAVADGVDALGMAGGDGSLAVVAAAARARELPFVCVPAGTRNHFALDLGVDRHDLVGALDAFGDQALERSIDVAEVNGRVFLNNVSLGIYGEAVQQTAYRDAKVRTLLETTAEVLGPSRAARELRLVDDLGASIVTRRWCSCRTTPTRSTAPSRPVRGRCSTAASSASSCSTARARGRILRPASGVRRTSRWTRQHPCMPASTARLSNWTRRSRS
jgi:Diacylglycerol kinase catalytic domain